ncbi:MAG: hypothetical protein AAGI37_21395 [Planctomycetota bacterium]
MQIIYRVGYWPEQCGEELSGADWPVPTDQSMIDPNWFGNDKERVVRYLQSGHIYAAEMGYSWCRFNCGIDDAKMGCYELTDGTWYWPEGLHHYIDKHDVILPEVFLSHMRLNNFQVPEKADWISWPYEQFQAECRFDDVLWKDWYHRRISS